MLKAWKNEARLQRGKCKLKRNSTMRAKPYHYTSSEILMAKNALFQRDVGPFQPVRWAVVGACQDGQPGLWLPLFPVSLDPVQPWTWGELNDEEQRFWPQMATECLLPCHILAVGPWLGRVLLIYRAPATSGPGMPQCTRQTKTLLRGTEITGVCIWQIT